MALSVEKTLSSARRMARRGDLDEARRLYLSVLETYPANRRALEGLKEIAPRPAGADAPDGVKRRLRILAGMVAAGHVAEALEAGRALVAEEPSAAIAHAWLGDVNARLGRHGEAIRHYMDALTIRPDFPEALGNLALTLHRAGRAEDAIRLFTAALRLTPGAAHLHKSLGTVLQKLGRDAEALASYRTAAALAPDDAGVNNNIGSIHHRAGRYEEALDSFGTALALDPSLVDAAVNRGNALKQLGRAEEAVEAYHAALALDPDNAAAHNNLGNLLRSLGRQDRALVHLERAVALDPASAPSWNNLGSLYSDVGRAEDARAAYERSLAIDPAHAPAHRHLAAMKRFTADDPHIARMVAVLEEGSPGPDARTHLHFALGKAMRDIGEDAASFDHFREGNRLRQAALGYRIEADRALFAAIRRIFAAAGAPPAAGGAGDAPLPVFVVGMPRSGTTLTEQILSSHSAVTAGGELGVLTDAVRPVVEDLKDDPQPRLGADVLARIRGAYFAGLTRHLSVEPGRRFTDKMPINFRWIGFILWALPEARIVHVHREPAATCWSIFTHYFSAAGNGYAYDLETVASYYNMYRDLMAFWRARFPGRIFDLDYERLVVDQEAVTRALLSACDLPFEEACLSFHENDRAVRTASALQVRRKLYGGSSAEWRRFEPFLSPMLSILDAWRPPDPAEAAGSGRQSKTSPG